MEAVVTVRHPVGLHARPAALFVKTAGRFSSQIQVRNLTRGLGPVDAKSILSVLTLGVEQSHQIHLQVEGKDEQEALHTLVDLVEQDFLAEE